MDRFEQQLALGELFEDAFARLHENYTQRQVTLSDGTVVQAVERGSERLLILGADVWSINYTVIRPPVCQGEPVCDFEEISGRICEEIGMPEPPRGAWNVLDHAVRRKLEILGERWFGHSV